MLDKERILIKIDELRGYLQELEQIMPSNFDEYQSIEKKRSCERLLQLSIESVIDVCKILVSNLRLGIPSEEIDLFESLFRKGIITDKILRMLKEMRGLRNILVHEYAEVDDKLIFKILHTRLNDFDNFIKIILNFIKKQENK
ncbi:MAG: hypothetical protein DRP69_02335 [Candidatus Duberdicusella sinuisediminis]|nr:MAG: hypothetical protein DRP69_02335 [Candidatus Omnitrophota bacterium]